MPILNMRGFNRKIYFIPNVQSELLSNCFHATTLLICCGDLDEKKICAVTKDKEMVTLKIEFIILVYFRTGTVTVLLRCSNSKCHCQGTLEEYLAR